MQSHPFGARRTILSVSNASSYYSLELTKKDFGPDDSCSMDIHLDMPVRYTIAHNMVEENCGQAAVERGPYCILYGNAGYAGWHLR